MSDWSESPNVTEETYNAVQWGKKLERERIKQIIQDWFDYDGDTSEGSKNLLAWIDEEITNEQ